MTSSVSRGTGQKQSVQNRKMFNNFLDSLDVTQNPPAVNTSVNVSASY